MSDTRTAAAAPLTNRPDTLDFLLTRRSRPPKTLAPPVPDREEVATLLQAAARVPDHGKLEPWRFVVLERAACARLAELTAEIGRIEGRDPDALAKDVAGFADAHLVVAVILSPKPPRRSRFGSRRCRRAPCACRWSMPASPRAGARAG
jgi:nitroreductase